MCKERFVITNNFVPNLKLCNFEENMDLGCEL